VFVLQRANQSGRSPQKFSLADLGILENPRFSTSLLRMSPRASFAYQPDLAAFHSVEDASASLPTYQDKPIFEQDAAKVIAQLKGMDWSFTNDYTRFLAHDLHPYPAKFIPQIPGTLISCLSTRGDLVFDPFGGSGTTALEAIRLGRRAVSLDANPVAALIGRVKTARVEQQATGELHQLHAALRSFLASMPTNPGELVEKFGSYAPQIANRSKWFSDEAFGELAHIKSRISQLQSPTACDIASLALSRCVLSASFQDSETRYKSVPRAVPVGETTKRFIREFEFVMRSVAENASATRYGISKFITGDVRSMPEDELPDGSVDLVATSPPYGNAMDYHLYHRFRLLWLGHDPIAFGRTEIGSHLKHQRESSGFETYFNDMILALSGMARVLKHGRYAVLVIGDSVYEGENYDTARLLAARAKELKFDASDVFERDVHKHKRSFTPAGRRASKESLLILRKKAAPVQISFVPPPYKLWPYEVKLREREGALTAREETVKLSTKDLPRARTMVFSHQIRFPSGFSEPTWQAILENGMAANPAARKEPKYVTHGLHPYKGKFYPQLAKALINVANPPHGARILDPFCGSGTTLLEGYLNGFSTFGCDVHPLAAKIATAKTAILDEEPDIFTEVVSGIIERLDAAPAIFPMELDQFNPDSSEEIGNWFAPKIAQKLNWLLKAIRAGSEGPSRDFLEVVVSSIVREISNQEPTDLRIRYRKELLEDADVLGLFRSQLETQFARVEKFWKVRGYAPNPFYRSTALCGDNRKAETFTQLGIAPNSIDLVLTSPPYAMALPYIDTDRLSLLTLFGLGGSERRPLENALIGSREITARARKQLEIEFSADGTLPETCLKFVRGLSSKLAKSTGAGFRRQNMPALMHRFLTDMNSVYARLHEVCRTGADVFVVIGDSRMTIDDKELRIPTTDFLEEIGRANGFEPVERIDISVTTENLVHIKNAITENAVLRMRKLG